MNGRSVSGARSMLICWMIRKPRMTRGPHPLCGSGLARDGAVAPGDALNRGQARSYNAV